MTLYPTFRIPFPPLMMNTERNLSTARCATHLALGYLAPVDVMTGFEQWGWKERRITHYSPNHSILLVGEGNFSFSLSLAKVFGSARNIVATSLDTFEEFLTKYPKAGQNLWMLKNGGATVIHGVDATEMSKHDKLNWKRFDRIIFNFPHVGFYGKEDIPELIELHRDLVRGFLMNASRMLWPNGEIHVNHKITEPFLNWKIDELAGQCSLRFIGKEMFRIEDYPGYENKRGQGPKSNDPFPLGESRTYIFKLPSFEQPLEGRRYLGFASETHQHTQIPLNVQQRFVRCPLQPQLSSLTPRGYIYASDELPIKRRRIFEMGNMDREGNHLHGRCDYLNGQNGGWIPNHRH